MNDQCENWREKIRRGIGGGLEEDGSRVADHIDTCEVCRQYHRSLLDDHQQLAGYAASLDDVISRIEQRTIAQLTIGSDAKNQEGMARVIPLRRRIMNMIMTRYGAAAAVLLAVVAGFGLLNQWNDTGLAWADVLKQVTAARSVTYKAVTGEGGRSAEIRIRTAADHTAVYDIHTGEKLFMRIFYDPDEQAMITLMPGTKQYVRKELTREEYLEQRKSENPSYLLERLLSFEHTDLGTREIDGVTAVGIESDDPRLSAGLMVPFSMRLWVDVQTEWPVRIEIFRENADGSEEPLSTLTEFQWDSDLDPVDFTLEVPADYMPQVDFGSFDIDEKHAIEGLKLFSSHSGSYPKHLVLAGSKEDRDQMDDFADGVAKDFDMSKGPAGLAELMKPYFEACMFLQRLTGEQRDVAWNGGEVMPGEADRVLWRWRLDDGNYRVIYGDLTAGTVSPELLKQLESE
jgi:hypothetical protein